MSRPVIFTPEQAAQMRFEQMVDALEVNQQRTDELAAEQAVRERDKRRVLWLAPLAACGVIASAWLAESGAIWALSAVTLAVIVIGTLGHLAAYNSNTMAANARLGLLHEKRCRLMRGDFS